MVSKEENILNIYIVVLLAATICGAQGRRNFYGDNYLGSDLYPPETPTMWCFQCSTIKDKDCAFIAPNDTSSYHYKPCLDTDKYNGTQPFCRKIVQKITVRDNMEIVIRKCGWVRHPRLDCYNLKNEDHDETICQCFELGCNGSPSLQHIGPLATTVAGLLMYLGFGGF